MRSADAEFVMAWAVFLTEQKQLRSLQSNSQACVPRQHCHFSFSARYFYFHFSLCNVCFLCVFYFVMPRRLLCLVVTKFLPSMRMPPLVSPRSERIFPHIFIFSNYNNRTNFQTGILQTLRIFPLCTFSRIRLSFIIVCFQSWILLFSTILGLSLALALKGAALA